MVAFPAPVWKLGLPVNVEPRWASVSQNILFAVEASLLNITHGEPSMSTFVTMFSLCPVTVIRVPPPVPPVVGVIDSMCGVSAVENVMLRRVRIRSSKCWSYKAVYNICYGIIGKKLLSI